MHTHRTLSRAQIVGGPIFTTPETVIETMRRVNTDVEALHGEIGVNTAKLPPQLLAAWSAFRLEWQAFYGANQSEVSMLFKGTGTVMRETQDYAARLMQWRAEVAAQPGIKLVTPAPLVLRDPSTPPGGGSTISDLTKLLHATAVIAGIGLVAYVAVVYVPKFLPAGKG